MREIKFRAWDKQLKQMVIVESFDCVRTPPYWYSPLLNNPEEVRNEKCIPSCNFQRNIKETEFIIMQYTGLKEIYEGDIVKWENEIDEIIWEEPTFKMKGQHYDIFSGCYGDLEVIGNIYENPELLK